MSVEVMTVITVASILFGIYNGLKNTKRADTSDIESRAREQATVNVKLDTIGSDCKDIKRDIGTVKEDMQELSKRLTIVERDVKSAHKRIDRLDENSRHHEEAV